jgi:ATP-binding cassette subfamily B protein
VSFSYEEDQDLLQDVSFTVKGGTTLGILGGTGSGKSTLMLLLGKLYPLPENGGSIRIGGTDIRDIDTAWLRKNIAMVLQEPFLFSRSIRENIAMAEEAPNEADIRSAARIACLEDSVDGFPSGFDTFVGERGVTLSGGQKQRVAIARALMRQAPIMVFDDSLSAVDTETDARIRAGLSERFQNSTVFLISHRIVTLKNADLILVMDRGRVAEIGTHDDLRQAGGLYQRICEIQEEV